MNSDPFLNISFPYCRYHFQDVSKNKLCENVNVILFQCTVCFKGLQKILRNKTVPQHIKTYPLPTINNFYLAPMKQYNAIKIQLAIFMYGTA